MEKVKVVVFDIDDTLTNSEPRQHILEEIGDIKSKYPKEILKADKKLKAKVEEMTSRVWLNFHEESKNDKPIQKMIDLVYHHKSLGHEIHFYSGRSDEVRKDTVSYFKKLNIEPDLLKLRRKEQKIKAPYLKNAWLNKYIVNEGKDVVCVYEDNQPTIDYLVSKGFNCVHVDDIEEKKELKIKPKKGRKMS